jgi:hypothetical protein
MPSFASITGKITSGVRDYGQNVRAFSRNASLYLISMLSVHRLLGFFGFSSTFMY